MNPDRPALIRHRMGRAREALEEARLLLEAGHLNTYVSRLYYACFYAVSALLLSEGETASKHSGVRALFDQKWVKTGRVPTELGRFYRKLFESRQRGDYADFVQFQEEEVQPWLDQATRLVDLLESLR